MAFIVKQWTRQDDIKIKVKCSSIKNINGGVVNFYTLTLSAIILLVCLLAVPCFGEVPKLIEYFGELHKLNGSPYPTGFYDITFSICTGAGCITSIWAETHTVEISGKNKKEFAMCTIVKQI